MGNNSVPNNATKDEHPTIRPCCINLKESTWADLVRIELRKIRTNLKELTPCVPEETQAHGNIIRSLQIINTLVERNATNEQCSS